jgi:putative membrane protein
MSKEPVLIEEDDLPESNLTPDLAPPVPDLVQGAAMTKVTQVAARPASRFSRIFWGALTGLIGMMVSVAAWDFAFGMLARNVWLGRLAIVLGGIVLLSLLVFVLGELAALGRLRKIDKLQEEVREASASGDLKEARRLSRHIEDFYHSREELRWGREKLAAGREELLDADAILDLTEREMLGPLDQLARREIEAAARQVAAATALIPLALADVVTALVANVRMIRRIAGVYGGLSGSLGSWRLLKSVASHLVATGAVAVGDDMISSVAGGGLLAKLSRRFGEGVVNGALTARVGVAAMEVCRPMPFKAVPKPRVTNIIQRALTGLFSS